MVERMRRKSVFMKWYGSKNENGGTELKSKGVKIGVGISTLIMAALLVAGAMIPGYVPSSVESTTGNPRSIAFNPELENGHAYLEYASIDGSQENGSSEIEKMNVGRSPVSTNAAELRFADIDAVDDWLSVQDLQNFVYPGASPEIGSSYFPLGSDDAWRFDAPFYDEFRLSYAQQSAEDQIQENLDSSQSLGVEKNFGEIGSYDPLANLDVVEEARVRINNSVAEAGVDGFLDQGQAGYSLDEQEEILEDDSPYFDEFRVGVNALNLAAGNGTMTASYHQQRLADSVDERQEVLRLQEEMSKLN